MDPMLGNAVVGLLFGVVAFFLCLTSEVYSLISTATVENGGYYWKTVKKLEAPAWVSSILTGLLVGGGRFVCDAMPEDTFLNLWLLIGIAIMVGYYAGSMLWPEDGWADEPREVAPIIILLIWQYTTVNCLVHNIAGGSWVYTPLVQVITLGTIAIFAITIAYRVYKKDEKKHRKLSRLVPVGVVTCLVVFALAITSAIGPADAETNKSNASGQPVTAEQLAAAVSGTGANDASWCYIHNLAIIKSSDIFNFGVNTYHDGMTVEEVYATFKDWLKVDPVIGAADIAFFDAILKTRFMGVFYDSVKNDWAQSINDAKVAWINDQNSYITDYYDVFFAFLDDNIANGNIEITLEWDRTAQDQMYINRYTSDGIPDVIVLTTDQSSGPWLVFHVTIKGDVDVKTVALRVPCGFQPSNVQEAMGIAPQERPVVPDEVITPPATTPPETTPPSDETPPVTPPPVTPPEGYEKNPSESNNSGNNFDTSGAGDWDASDSVGADGSHGMSSYEQYEGAVSQNEQPNQNVNTGESPTYTPPPAADGGTTDVDSVTQDTIKTPSTPPQESSVVQGEQAQQWSGPAD